MTTRRDFLGSVAASTSAFGLGAGWSPELPLTPLSIQQSPVPPAIAALTSLAENYVGLPLV